MLKKQNKGILTGFGIMMIVACGMLIFFVIKNKNYALIVVACGCFTTLLPMIVSLGQIEKEIKQHE